ncbi:MAG TPA: ribosome small subunit-dependent GTPase A, partial [Planctomycetota bacterium]|nr:ribosome small subunit-dependent GTPase A [Planctomycetota bacterium]
GFGSLPERCRFSDCLHRKEPGCAVRAAIAAGELPAERHERYLRLLEEVEARVNPFA